MHARVGAFLVVAAVSVALVTGVVGAGAQSPAPTSAVWFTGSVFPAPCEDATPSFAVTPQVTKVRGLDCHGAVQATDPRFAGDYERLSSVDTYTIPDAGSVTMATTVHTIINDGGAWDGSPSTALERQSLTDEDDSDLAPETVVFKGRGGYAGSTAIVVFDPLVNGELRGIIITGPSPEP